MDLTKEYSVAAPIDVVWRALTDPQIIEAWGGGPAVMDAAAGAQFSLWGGDIWGTNLTVEPPTRLVQEWYGGDWAEPSVADFMLYTEAGQTRLLLLHTRVPEDVAADFDSGWDDHYLGPLKELAERVTRAETEARDAV